MSFFLCLFPSLSICPFLLNNFRYFILCYTLPSTYQSMQSNWTNVDLHGKCSIQLLGVHIVLLSSSLSLLLFLPLCRCLNTAQTGWSVRSMNFRNQSKRQEWKNERERTTMRFIYVSGILWVLSIWFHDDRMSHASLCLTLFSLFLSLSLSPLLLLVGLVEK